MFQDKRKKTPLILATIEYQLNNSLFSSFNETLLLKWWIYDCYTPISITVASAKNDSWCMIHVS